MGQGAAGKDKVGNEGAALGSGKMTLAGARDCGKW